MSRVFIFIFFMGVEILVSAQNLDAIIQADAVYLLEGQDSILTYQLSEKSLNGEYKRTNYIHPLYSLNGQVLTEDFPEDHRHHRGIFWSWHQLYVGEKKLGDSWELKNFSWEIKSVKILEGSGPAKSIQAEVLWKSGLWLNSEGKEKEVVKEITTIKVYPAEKQYRQIDFEISIFALEKNVLLGGSENEKGYGGFSARIRLTEDMKFTSSTGNVIPDNLPVAAGEWMDFSGSIGNKGAKAGLTILCHPDNPGHPNPWILRKANSMQNAVYPHPGAIAVPISETQPTILRYRLIIHEGNMETIAISKIYADYSK